MKKSRSDNTKRTAVYDMYPFYWTKVEGVFLCAIHLNTKFNV